MPWGSALLGWCSHKRAAQLSWLHSSSRALWLASLELLQLDGMRYLLCGVDGVLSPAVERPESFAIQVAL